MSKGSKQTTTVELDPRFEAQRGRVFGEANRIAGLDFSRYGGRPVAGVDPSTSQGYETLGTVDPRLAAAFGGLLPNLDYASQVLQGATGPLDFSQYMDPYQAEVIAATQGDYSRLRDLATRDVGDQALAVGAFGGSRHGVAEGVAMGELGRAEASTLANIRSTGFRDAMQAALAQRGLGLNAAGLMTNLGFGGAQGLYGLTRDAAGAQVQFGELKRMLEQQGIDFDISEFMREQNDPFVKFGLLSSTLSAPYGQTTTVEQKQSPWNAILGAAATVAGTAFGGPAGGAAASQAFSMPSPQVLPIAPTSPRPATGPLGIIPADYQRLQYPAYPYASY